MEALQVDLIGKEKELTSLDQQLFSLKTKMATFDVEKKNAESIKQKIASLQNCPTCEQEVHESHKSKVAQREEEKLQKALQGLQQITTEETTLKEKKDILNLALQVLRKRMQDVTLQQYKLKDKHAKKEQATILSEKQDTIKKEIGALNSKKLDLDQKIQPMQAIEVSFQEQKTKVDVLFQKEKQLELEFVSLQKEKEGIEKLLDVLKTEITQKELTSKKLKDTTQLRSWFSKFFMSLIGTIERHVMQQIFLEFNEYFKQWFSVLLEDESISVRLDERFTPIIEQNGYETSLENLSGGEKTSVALAYRLALNKVINNVVSHLQTRDLLILDEPTDGFSSEQLDKMRDVLDQLKMKQIILVSHDAKIESFVNHVIRINKQEHESSLS